jgi:hypothetical protein
MSPAKPARPELAELQIADPPGRWQALGFVVHDGDRLALGAVGVTLGVPGQGITGWSIAGIDPAITSLDGLPTTQPPPDRPLPASRHPNGATGLDQVVIATPDFERTADALTAAGVPLRRIHDAPGGFRQGFRRLGPAILELVEMPPAPAGPLDSPHAPAGPARFWGLVVIVADLEALAVELKHRLGPIRPAVQPGRQIATLNKAAGLSPRVAFMDPEPDRLNRAPIPSTPTPPNPS